VRLCGRWDLRCWDLQGGKRHLRHLFHRSPSVCVGCAQALSKACAPVGLVRVRVGAVVPRVRADNVFATTLPSSITTVRRFHKRCGASWVASGAARLGRAVFRSAPRGAARFLHACRAPSMAGPVVVPLAVPLRSKSRALTSSALSPSASHSSTKQNGHALRSAMIHATASRYGRPSRYSGPRRMTCTASSSTAARSRRSGVDPFDA
jgi:hypothetical protein